METGPQSPAPSLDNLIARNSNEGAIVRSSIFTARWSITGASLDRPAAGAQARKSRQSASHIRAERRRLSTSTRSSWPWNISGYSVYGMRIECRPKP